MKSTVASSVDASATDMKTKEGTLFDRYRTIKQTPAILIVVVCALLAALQQPPTITLELEAVADART